LANLTLYSGKVYRGTWNQTEVAIKVLQNVAGVTASVVVGRTHICNNCTHLLHRQLLRKEIDVGVTTAFLVKWLNLTSQLWLTLRHPNVLQFLGANTLDDTPFVVMPYIPYNARQFLEQRSTFNPVYIVSQSQGKSDLKTNGHQLRDVALALQYLHSRKICHGDLKGVSNA
jgi:serine/threonine protein kinase